MFSPTGGSSDAEPGCATEPAVHDDPNPGPRLDGLLLDITGWTADEIQTGAALMTELGQFGAGGRALYDPRPGERGR
ncbi:hypothetical protein ACGFYU_37510 [Streptomyces sp. NPDC048337]|uniref:hypothetical protein n=1 Tax=Streptomyces sp. NPDC048337 TaxID=3365535 RepID=UPI0037115CE3